VNPAVPNVTFIRSRAVCARTGLSRTTVWRLERAGVFPRRYRLSPHAVAWAEHEIEAWARGQMAASPEPSGDLLTEREIRQAYRLPQPTVRAWVRRGMLTAIVQSDGELRFKRDDVERRLARLAAELRECRVQVARGEEP
jgi:prophage regulatory protein